VPRTLKRLDARGPVAMFEAVMSTNRAPDLASTPTAPAIARPEFARMIVAPMFPLSPLAFLLTGFLARLSTAAADNSGRPPTSRGPIAQEFPHWQACQFTSTVPTRPFTRSRWRPTIERAIHLAASICAMAIRPRRAHGCRAQAPYVRSSGEMASRR
jgi:hypothetical protein